MGTQSQVPLRQVTPLRVSPELVTCTRGSMDDHLSELFDLSLIVTSFVTIVLGPKFLWPFLT